MLLKYSDFWSVQLNRSFRGLLKDIRVNGEPLDDEVIAGWSDDELCPHVADQQPGRRYCDPNPCANAGKCREGWHRFHCDCDEALYNGGAKCEKGGDDLRWFAVFFSRHPEVLNQRMSDGVNFCSWLKSFNEWKNSSAELHYNHSKKIVRRIQNRGRILLALNFTDPKSTVVVYFISLRPLVSQNLLEKWKTNKSLKYMCKSIEWFD